MANGESRYHAEVKGKLDGTEVRVNVFADTLTEVFEDIGKVHAQLFESYRNPAKREIVNAQLKAEQPHVKAALKAEQAAWEGLSGKIPVCENCGSQEFMELISFLDKKTGKPRQAWKCQQCQKWIWPAKNGKGQ